MSIHALKLQINAGLDQFKSNREFAIELTSPAQLEKQLIRIEKKYSDLESTLPQSNRILEAIVRMETNDQSNLSNRDWRYIAWGLCAKFEDRPQRLIATNAGRQILMHFYKLGKEMSVSLYIALLVGYFSLKSSERDQFPKNWLLLRKVLNDTFPILMAESKRPREWMKIIKQYPELLNDNPTSRLSIEFLDSLDDEHIPRLVEQLKIPTTGWFWESLVKDALQSVCSLPETHFLPKLERLLLLRLKLPTFTEEILKSLLSRYADSSMRSTVHEQLKKLALEVWGNPQSPNMAGWNNVMPDTRAMVVSWFVRADLEAFFYQFGDVADKNRFDYWLRFINQISYTHIFLGTDARRSRKPEHMHFKLNNVGRFSFLDGSLPGNSSFILQIGNIFIVEFSEMGPVFIHRSNPIKYQQPSTHKDVLRGAGDRHPHFSGWQNNVDDALAKLGIYPDATFSRRPSRSNTNYKRN